MPQRGCDRSIAPAANSTPILPILLPAPSDGRLPQVSLLMLLNNALSGPAFPAAWQQAGAFPNLVQLMLGGNLQLTGTLPAQLPWPAIAEL